MAEPDASAHAARLGVVRSAIIASGAFVVPLAMSTTSSPSPNHPRIFLWYQGLKMPWFKPPDWVIPVAWTAIEGSLATAAYRLTRSGSSSERQNALGWLGWNVFMIGAWSRLFFKHRSLPISTLAAASMVASGVQFVKAARPVDTPAAKAGIPFVAWVTFATVLTANIWALNRKR